MYETIQIFKKNFFDSENQLQIFVNLLFSDYFKFFGFISGIKNGFFNYYDSMIMYYLIYFHEQKFLNIDITLLKYLFILNEKNINIDFYLKKSNIENSFALFENIFLSNDDKDNKTKKYNNNKNISSDDLIDLLNNSYDIF